MASETYAAEPGHWFLRGVQSAIFYYVSLTPCLEFQHKRKRRREAKEARTAHAAQAEIITTQPQPVRQPRAFETNEAWAYELMLGPGPPKGWKADTLLRNVQKHMSKKEKESNKGPKASEMPPPQSQPTPSPGLSTQPTQCSTRPSSSNTATTASEVAGPIDQKPGATPSRPHAERRLSSAFGNIKDTLRVNLHPDGWNWKRYNRDDEVLFGFSERMRGLWNRAISGSHHEEIEAQDVAGPSVQNRKRAATNESDRYDYQRARNPEVNELHPPIVSQLPATRGEARWMLLPPPSAAVMAGKKQATEETQMRWPMCVIGSKRPFFDSEPPLKMTRSTQQLDEQDVDISDTTSVGSIDIEDDVTENMQQASTVRTKHLSDPIIKPPPIHPRASVRDDLFVPKRSDSWQFHCIVPPDQTKW
ncbi:hypothetical protein PV05_08442 [Exophiala xenobiotica]|uniref:Uncharacterized protein n=1 Tax=Exophiala xenobiotica TaxID=348802 RepID=A0A0D2EDQ2_9EURO|nr:uncharacterized protein PV05_08442 [Exophiala xenobiotica]KIW52825.1 hypothetical protein PV05_08442 [Exophiala xenobiotica]